ncbi:MAG: SCO1664 family protein [Candidatus Planktophila sp.]
MDIDAKARILTRGELEVTGRLIDASNATLYATSTLDGVSITCIYKPIAGERALWDFPDGTLAHREYAAFLLSDFLQLDLVPLTVLRDGPYGEGMVQEWIEIDQKIDLAEFFSTQNPQLRSMAFYDAIINNTDRKIGHLLPDQSGKVFGCDHGVTFHSDDKLRTVLWQWAGDQLYESELEQLRTLTKSIGREIELSPYLTAQEIQALQMRISRLLEEKTMPTPSQDWPPVPWPAF